MSPAPLKVAPKAESSHSGLSWEDGNEQLVVIVQGQFGSGKTTLAATLSKHFPSTGLATSKHKGPPKHILKDLFWLCYDKGALLSFRERGIAVPRFDVRSYMAEKKCSIIQATEVGLREAEKAIAAGAEWVIPDTLSTFDKGLDAHWHNIMFKEAKADPRNAGKNDNELIEKIQIPKYGRMFVYHKMLHDNLMNLGAGVCYLTHSKALVDLGLGSSDDREKQKKVRAMVQTASGGLLVPDITGKGAGVYKADARLQLVVRASKGVGGKMTRKVSADSPDGYETKNSWELSIQGEQEPHLGKLLAKIRD